jgi:CTP synthase (UTP-ammonia lyase)
VAAAAVTMNSSIDPVAEKDSRQPHREQSVSGATSISRIALVGDQSPSVKAHVAIPKALKLAAGANDVRVEETWINTAALEREANAQLRGFHGIWCAPGSPYASMEGALNAIRFARERKVPFLGTCGGSQHALIEFARNVLGLPEADHGETNPNATLALITPLPCALRETETPIHLLPASRVRRIYGRTEIVEPFNCGFGLNPQHQQLFDASALKITGVGDDGIARVIELESHPFFIATLFQPERSALKEAVHPLITAFLQAASTA